MRVCHGVTAVFDDPNLVSCAGLAPVLELAERAGLRDLVAEHVQLNRPGGQNAVLRIVSLVAGMVAGADSIDDMALLRHGAMRRLFSGARAPSTLGTFLRAFTFGHVRQLDAVASRLLINLARRAPVLAGVSELAYVDVDDTVKPTFGYAKQGAGRGYTGIKGLNALVATICTASSRPVIAAVRLRKGSTISASGAHRFVADALITAKNAGATGVLVLRADAAFFQSDDIGAVLRRKARFSRSLVAHRSAAKKADARLRISFARRSSRFSCSRSLIRPASLVLRPGAAPPSMSACFTQLRNDSTPILSWPATRPIVPVDEPSYWRSCRTSRTACSFSATKYRSVVGGRP